MTIRIDLLGAPRTTAVNGADVKLPARAYLLLARLACDRRKTGITRQQAAALLWEDQEAGTAAVNLRQLLSRLRAASGTAGAPILKEEDGLLLLDPDVRVDVHVLRGLASERRRIHLDHLFNLYPGDLLDGQPLSGRLGQWLQAERAALRAGFTAVVKRQLDPLPEPANPPDVFRAIQCLLEHERFSQVAYRAWMRMAARSGHQDQVSTLMRELEQGLNDQKGSIESATRSLYRELTGTAQPARAMAVAASRPSVPSPAPAEGPGIPRVSLLMPAADTPGPEHSVACSLVDDITINLCRFRGLTVLAPHTSWQISSSPTRHAIFEDFRLDYVADTQLRRLGGVTSLAIKLYAVRGREVIWADQFPFEAERSVGYYHELTNRVVLALTGSVEHAELGRTDLLKHPTAYRLYLEGKHQLSSLDLASIRRARASFKAALAASANFVPAISGLARTFQREWLLLARDDHGLLEEARTLAARSIALDGEDARGYRERGISGLYLRQYDDCVEAYETAEHLNPQHADLLADHADALVHAGDVAAAIAKIKRAIDLNPLCPDGYWWTLGGASYLAEDYRGAIRAISRMRQPAPAHQLRAAAHAMLDEAPEAAHWAARAKENHPDFNVAHWMRIVPFRDTNRILHYQTGLRRAGFI